MEHSKKEKEIVMLEKALAVIKSDDPFVDARVRALMTVYHEVWANRWKDYEILDVEKEFSFPLINPETEAKSRSFNEGGKIDVVVRHRDTNRIVVVEHKTTVDSVDPDSDYWDRLRLDNQCTRYTLASTHMGEQIDCLIYDVIRKPGQRPSSIPLTDESGSKIVHDASGTRVKTKDGKKWRESGDSEQGYALQTRTETPAEFEARLLSLFRADTSSYFAQREVPRLDSDIISYMENAWAISQQILYFRNKKLWSQNPQACKAFGTCEMFDLCCGRASIDGIRYRAKANVHSELKIQSSDGKELLTSSRVYAFDKCRRYHFHKYEEPIEKVQDEDPEALRLGTLMHLALEQYFNAMKSQRPA